MKKEYFRREKFWNFNKSWDAEPITEEWIQEAERALEVTLPSTYLELLKVQNGGAINFPLFDYGNRVVWMDHLFGIDFNEEGIGRGILDSSTLIQERHLPVPTSKALIIWGDYHHFIALDYQNSHNKPEPSVIYFWEMEDHRNPWRIIQLAPNFDEFLSKLYRRKSEIKKIYKQYVRLKYVNI